MRPERWAGAAGAALVLCAAAAGVRADGGQAGGAGQGEVAAPPADPAVGGGPPAEPPPAVVHDEVIGILDIRVEGLSTTASEVLTRGVAEAVGKAGYMVVLPERLREVMTTTPFNSACRVGPCLGELHRQADVGMVLVAGINAIGANHDYVVTLMDTPTGLPIGQIQRSCDVCTIDEAIDGIAAAAIELVVRSAGRAPDPVVELGPPPPGRRASPPRPRLRRAGMVLLGSALVVVSGGLIVRDAEHRDLGSGLVGAGATLAVAGGACLAMSFTF
jgi:hypothetical protein